MNAVNDADAAGTANNADTVDTVQARAWRVLQQVPDPEVPAISICELGIVRDVAADASGLRITLTPTYSGCPATEVIADSVRQALHDAGLGPVTLCTQLAPPWTTDWISDEGRRKLRACGIAPPHGSALRDDDGNGGGDNARPIHLRTRDLPCPRCGSVHTERLSAFGSTACKALHRCLDCREPFEHFKPL